MLKPTSNLSYHRRVNVNMDFNIQARGTAAATNFIISCVNKMSNKIDHSDLKIGMKIKVNKNWLDTTLLKNTIRLKSKKDIDRLKPYSDFLYLIDDISISKNIRILSCIFDDIKNSKIINNKSLTLAINNIASAILSGRNIDKEINQLIHRDKDLFKKSVRLLLLAISYSKFIGLSRERLMAFAKASFLHDISLAKKKDPRKITPEEIISHSQESYDILVKLKFDKEIINTILFHHENYDGSGYPFGISGRAIHLESRILRILDSYIAMTMSRCYRTSFMTPEKAANELFLQAKINKLDPIQTAKFLSFINIYPSGITVENKNSLKITITASSTDHLYGKDTCNQDLYRINKNSVIRCYI